MSRIAKVEIPGRSGIRLSGILHRPKSKPSATVVMTPCFTCSKDYKVLAWTARNLAAKGIAVLRYDLTGLGESSGDFADTSISTDLEDLRSVCRWLQNEGLPPSALVGHSMGGMISILAAPSVDSVNAVAVLASSSETDRFTRLLSPDHWSELETTGATTVDVMGRPYALGQVRMEDLKRHSILEAAARLKARFLVLHGDADQVVPIAEGMRLFTAAPFPKAFYTVAGADHLFSQRPHAEEASRILEVWIKGAEND